MDKIVYTQEKMDAVKTQVQQEYQVDVIMTWIQNEMDLHKGE